QRPGGGAEPTVDELALRVERVVEVEEHGPRAPGGGCARADDLAGPDAPVACAAEHDQAGLERIQLACKGVAARQSDRECRRPGASLEAEVRRAPVARV